MTATNYLNVIHNIQANLNAAEHWSENGDDEGAKSCSDVAYDLWDSVAADIRAGVTIPTDGWSEESKQLLQAIIDRAEEDVD